MLRPNSATNSNNPLHMVRHYDELVQRNKRKMQRISIQHSRTNITERRQFNSAIQNSSKRAFLFIAAYRDEE